MTKVVQIFCLGFIIFGSKGFSAPAPDLSQKLQFVEIRAQELQRQFELWKADKRFSESSLLVGVLAPEIGTSIRPLRERIEMPSSEEYTCGICIEPMTPESLTDSCNSCKQIWHSHCFAKCFTESPADRWGCPDPGCIRGVPRASVFETEEQVWKVVQEFVRSSKCLGFCPGADCGLLLTYRKTNELGKPLWTQTCPRCQHVSCPKCEVRHDGTTCEEYRSEIMGRRTDYSDAELAEWENNSNYFRCFCGHIFERQSGCGNVTCGRDYHRDGGILLGCGRSFNGPTDGRRNLIEYIRTLREGARPSPAVARDDGTRAQMPPPPRTWLSFVTLGCLG